jgi:Xaa-Pro aminopeptidase
MTQGKLLYGKGADSFYATGASFPDDIIYFEDANGKSHGCFSALEIDRARATTKLDHIHSLESVMKILQEEQKVVSMANVILRLLEMTDTKEVKVGADFSAKMYKQLVSAGIEVTISDILFSKRIIKTSEEIEKIRIAQSINEEGFKLAFDILHNATIGDEEKLIWNDKVLTSEILRNQMNAKIASLGGVANEGGPIIACGVQGAQPHNIGEGALYANQLIVMDSYPMHPNKYYGDLSRTVLKGTASKQQAKLYKTVKDAQEMGVNMVKTGVVASSIHEAINTMFIEEGYKTGTDKNGNQMGFFHGTGHNVGLSLHDVGPGVSLKNNLLETNQVITIEPGLYYPDIGGVRIEDIVAVTEDGPNNLTTLEKFLEL